jgi:uncharacterized protein (DUF58 family)
MLSVLSRASETLRNLLGLHAHTGDASAPLLARDEIMRLRALANAHSREPTAPAPEVRAHLAGDRRSVYRGSGMDFEESRRYAAGDDVRYMNWRLTARFDAPFMKVFREERRPAVFIAIDRRSAMRFATRTRLKAAQAARVAAVCAFLAADRGAAVGGLVVESPLRWIPTRGGQAGAMELIRAAAAACPPTTDAADTPALSHILRLMDAALPPGSELFVVSDFSGLTDQDLPVLLRLSGNHAIRAVEILDPGELELPNAGRLWLEPLDNDTPLFVDTADPALRATYANAAEQCLASRRRVLETAGVPITHLYSDAELDARFVELLTEGPGYRQ